MLSGSEQDPGLPSVGDFGTALVAMTVVVVVVVVVVLLARAGRRGTTGPREEPPEPLATRQDRTRSAADRLRELQALRDSGALTDAEYADQRAAIVKDI